MYLCISYVKNRSSPELTTSCYNNDIMHVNFNSFGPMSFFGFGLLSFMAVGLIGIILMAGIMALKGYALWHAARRNEVGWFIGLLVVNTFGILELVYLYFIVGKWNKSHNKGSSDTAHSDSIKE